MAIDIDGYNTMFRNFAEFAQKCVDAGASEEIVTVKEDQPLDGRRILSISNTHMDALYRMRRGGELKDVNDFTRTLFKDAIVDLFGGESKIPENVKTDAIRKLSPSSTALQFHTAVAQLRDNIQNGIVKSGLEKALVGGDEVEAARGFFTQAVLSKCGRSTLDTMRSAFGTETASKLVRLYDLVYRREVGAPDVSHGLSEYTADQGAVSKKTMARLKSTLGLLCGALQDEPDLIEEFQGELDYEELEAFDIVQDMLKAGREAKDVSPGSTTRSSTTKRPSGSSRAPRTTNWRRFTPASDRTSGCITTTSCALPMSNPR